MKSDGLYVIVEMISDKTKILYANKRRQLKGLPPLSPEEEAAYAAPAPIDTPKSKVCWVHQTTRGNWEAYNTHMPKQSSFLATRPRLDLLIDLLVTMGKFNTLYRNKFILNDHSMIEYRPLSKEEIDNYIKQAREYEANQI